MDLATHHSNKLKTYEFFGVEFSKNGDGKEVTATCPFCGKEKHFYVNTTSALFDCKRCGLSGTYIDFLTNLFNDLLKFNESDKLKKLADWRGLPLEALEGYNILCANDKYWIPIYNHNYKIQDIRYYTLGTHLYSIDGVDMCIFNLPELLDQKRKDEPVYMCEGEFDAMSLKYLLRKVSKPGVVVGIPGKNTLKTEWHDYFLNRDIINCYDAHDGESGFQKVKNFLTNRRSLKRICWPPEQPKGFDVNDFVKIYGVQRNNYEQCYNILDLMVKSDEVRLQELESKYKDVPDNITLPDLILEYRKTLEVSKEYETAIRLLLSTIISINIPGPDPLWLFFVGPPSCGKTALLNTARSCNLCFYQSTLGRHSLISGWKMPSGIDPSILANLNNKCFILKDFTEVLFKSMDERNEIFSIMRGAFDGYVERQFGNAVHRIYKNLRFSTLAGVTQEIHNYPQASAGDRFLRFNFPYDENALDKALEQSIFGEELREVLQVYVNKFVNKKWDFSPDRIKNLLTLEFKNRLKPLARLIAHLRTPVVRFERGRKNESPVYEPISESANRLAVQLQRLALSLAIIENKDTIDEEIHSILRTVAFDTIDGYATNIVKALYKSGKALVKPELEERVRISSSSMTPYLEDLELLKIINKKEVMTARGKLMWAYYVTPSVFELFARVEL